VPGIVGFAAALKLCFEEMPTEVGRLTLLRDKLAAGLISQLEAVEICGPALDEEYADGTPLRLPGNLNLSFGNVDGEALLLAMGNLAVSSGAACTSVDPEPSHVLRALGFSNGAARSSLRFGLGRFNGEADIDAAIERVTAAVRRIRRLL
jgi:cysteine desulfurase